MNPVRKIRKDNNISRMALSAKTGVSHTAIQLLEKGATKMPQPQTLKSLAAFANMEPEILRTEYANWLQDQRQV